jgi:hypothetical protein
VRVDDPSERVRPRYDGVADDGVKRHSRYENAPGCGAVANDADAVVGVEATFVHVGLHSCSVPVGRLLTTTEMFCDWLSWKYVRNESVVPVAVLNA